MSVNKLMNETMEQMKRMIDVDTIVGSPITTPDGTTIIPVSKVTMGVGTGGTDFVPKNAKNNAQVCFGGGSGSGVSISPVCFLVVSPTEGTHILPINEQASTTADRLVEMLPGAVGRVSSFFESRKASKAEQAAAQAEQSAERAEQAAQTAEAYSAE